MPQRGCVSRWTQVLHLSLPARFLRWQLWETYVVPFPLAPTITRRNHRLLIFYTHKIVVDNSTVEGWMLRTHVCIQMLWTTVQEKVVTVHTCTQTHTHTYTHTCIHAHMYAHTHARTRVHTHTHTHTHTHYKHTCTNINIHIHAQMHMHKYTCTHPHTQLSLPSHPHITTSQHNLTPLFVSFPPHRVWPQNRRGLHPWLIHFCGLRQLWQHQDLRRNAHAQHEPRLLWRPHRSHEVQLRRHDPVQVSWLQCFISYPEFCRARFVEPAF